MLEKDSVGNIVNHDMVVGGGRVFVCFYLGPWDTDWPRGGRVLRESRGLLVSSVIDIDGPARNAEEERGALSQAPELEISWHER